MGYHIAATDDDPAIRKILNIILTKEGYTVSICSDGNELLTLLKQKSEEIDCILLDIKMPGISGVELLGVLQKQYGAVPVIMLTAFSDLDTGMKAIRSGAADYLSKPVRKKELLDRIDAAIAKSRRQLAEKMANEQISHQHKILEDQLNTAQHTITRTMMATIKAFSETIEQKDRYTQGHCGRVSRIALNIGRACGLSSSELMIVEGGALLHDIGKIGIPVGILNKPTPLDAEEVEILQNHVIAGERILHHIEMFAPYVPIVRSHHERYDGQGYPDGLKGNEIPLLVRIVTLADAFDAMTSGRSYRSSTPLEDTLLDIVEHRNRQFDPELVDLFINQKLYQVQQ
jgi:putative two-component system response regulator